MTIVTAREFNQQASRMLEAARQGPVFITRRGKIVGVLSSYDAYQQQQARTLAESFSGQHPAADLDDAFDAELSAIRQQSRLRYGFFEAESPTAVTGSPRHVLVAEDQHAFRSVGLPTPE
ncbi:MAG: type II toxin-antitoxin system Phd/YefM family antitoxin [Lautropia sp.]|nr:type II toxin-antitoxin system Phd/YefM family antitoxin [Lautropia sp.]